MCVCVCVSFHYGYDPYVHMFISFSLGVSPVLPYGENYVTELLHCKKVNKDSNFVIYARCEYLSVHNATGRNKIKNSGCDTFWDKEQ